MAFSVAPCVTQWLSVPPILLSDGLPHLEVDSQAAAGDLKEPSLAWSQCHQLVMRVDWPKLAEIPGVEVKDQEMLALWIDVHFEANAGPIDRAAVDHQQVEHPGRVAEDANGDGITRAVEQR